MKCGLTVTEISEDRQSCKEQQSDDFESHVLWDVESSLLFYIRCTWPIPILYLQDSAKSGIGSYPYKLPPLNPSTTSSSTIPNTRGYEESRGPPTQSHKTAQSPQSMGPPSQNPHIHHSTYSYPNSRPSAQTKWNHVVLLHKGDMILHWVLWINGLHDHLHPHHHGQMGSALHPHQQATPLCLTVTPNSSLTQGWSIPAHQPATSPRPQYLSTTPITLEEPGNTHRVLH